MVPGVKLPESEILFNSFTVCTTSRTSTLDAVEEYKEAVLVFAESLAESQALQGYQFFKVFDENQLEYIILVKGETDGCFSGTESVNCL